VENFITTEQLTKTFNHHLVVNNIDLAVPTQSIYGFLGPNGAGKTTTIRMLLGLVRPSHGQISLLGKPLKSQKKDILRHVGALVETPSLYRHLTGKENLRVTATMLHVGNKRIDEVLQIVDLTEAANKRVMHYSQGMKQRLGLALALLNTPQILILDEPTNGLDPAGIRDMRHLIQSLPQEFGMTVFLSSHLLNEIEQVATHVGILHHGKLLFQGRLVDLQKTNETLEDVFMKLTQEYP